MNEKNGLKNGLISKVSKVNYMRTYHTQYRQLQYNMIRTHNVFCLSSINKS